MSVPRVPRWWTVLLLAAYQHGAPGERLRSNAIRAYVRPGVRFALATETDRANASGHGWQWARHGGMLGVLERARDAGVLTPGTVAQVMLAVTGHPGRERLESVHRMDTASMGVTRAVTRGARALLDYDLPLGLLPALLDLAADPSVTVPATWHPCITQDAWDLEACTREHATDTDGPSVSCAACHMPPTSGVDTPVPLDMALHQVDRRRTLYLLSWLRAVPDPAVTEVVRSGLAIGEGPDSWRRMLDQTATDPAARDRWLTQLSTLSALAGSA